MLIFEGACKCGWTYRWLSQPFIRDLPAGNLFLSCACLFAGLQAAKFWRALSTLRLIATDVRQFFRHQSDYLIPVVIGFWRKGQPALLAAVSQPATLGSDQRCDTPGMQFSCSEL